MREEGARITSNVSGERMTELFSDIEREPRRRLGRDAPWLRRAVLALFAIGAVAVLAGAIGQVPSSLQAGGAAAQMTAAAPAAGGEPVVLIADGRVLERNLRRERLTHAELEAEARLAQIGSLSQVRYAVLETNGRISFLTDER